VCSNSNGFNITSQSDLDNLSSCQNLTGNVIIQSSIPQASLNGVQRVDGDVRVLQDNVMTSFSAPDLETITGAFTLVNLTILSSLSLPQLTQVGSIDFEILPALQTRTFGGITQADDILITDTQLSSLNGIQLSSVHSFNINNNFFLKNVSQPELTEATGAVSIAFNAPSVAVDFPILTSMENGTFRQVASVDLPALANVTGDLGFIQNSFTTVNLPNLTSVQSSLSFVNNSQLTNVSAPMLDSIGGAFLIANNSKFAVIDFDSVSSVGGAVDWTGTYYSVSMASLSDVKGGLNVQTTATNFTCPFSNLRTNGVVKGDTFVCSGNVSHPTVGTNGTNVTANSGSGSGSSSSDTSTSGASYLVIPLITGPLFVAVVAAFL
jgi:hypothetical protein